MISIKNNLKKGPRIPIYKQKCYINDTGGLFGLPKNACSKRRKPEGL